MARLVKLPDGTVFREKLKMADTLGPVQKDSVVTVARDVIDAADKIVKSPGVGALVNVGERIYDSYKTGQQAEKAKAAAAAKMLGREPEAPIVSPAPPAPAQERMGRAAMERMGRRAPEQPMVGQEQAPPSRFLFPENVEERRQRMMRQPPPGFADPREPEQQVDFVVPQRDVRISPEEKPTPPTEFQGAPEPARVPGAGVMAPGGPAQPRAPQPPAPMMASPAPAQPQTVVTTPAPGGRAERVKAPEVRQRVLTNAGNIASGLATEVGRDRQAALQTLNRAVEAVGEEQNAPKAAQGLQEVLEFVKQVSPPSPAAQPLSIPEVVSVEELMGYAARAISPDQQQEVLKAFGNNIVTGMYARTLGERLSGDYRRPFLNAIVKSFPRQRTGQRQMHPIDLLYKATLAYETLGRGKVRSQEAAAGLGRERVAKTVATTQAKQAQAQRTMETARTEAELREAKRLEKLANINKKLADTLKSAVKKRAGRGRGRGRGKKSNLSTLRFLKSVTQDRIKQEINQNDGEARALQKEQRQQETIIRKAAALSKQRRPVRGSPQAAARAKAQAAAEAARERVKSIKEDLASIAELNRQLRKRERDVQQALALQAAGRLTPEAAAKLGIDPNTFAPFKESIQRPARQRRGQRRAPQQPQQQAPVAEDVFK